MVAVLLIAESIQGYRPFFLVRVNITFGPLIIISVGIQLPGTRIDHKDTVIAVVLLKSLERDRPLNLLTINIGYDTAVAIPVNGYQRVFFRNVGRIKMLVLPSIKKFEQRDKIRLI